MFNTCAANSASMQIRYLLRKNNYSEQPIPSRPFIYNTSQMKYTNRPIQDDGTTFDDISWALRKYGFCPESEFDYEADNIAVEPPNQCFKDAEEHQLLSNHQVNPDIDEIKNCMAEGYVISAGIPVYESFESEQVAETGIVPIPKPDEKLLGYHGILYVDYSDHKGNVLGINSWGKWGAEGKGKFYVPYELLVKGFFNDADTYRVFENPK
jgi:C1A family cysteine protease